MEIKGTVLLAIRDFVKTNHRDKFDEWLNLLGDDSWQIYSSSIDSTGWYPVSVAAVEPAEIIGQLFFRGDIQKGAWESGKHGAQKGLNGIYKILVKASSPSMVISKVWDILARHYRPCEMGISKNEKNGVVLYLRSPETIDPVIESGIGGWIERALEINGVTSPDIQITKSKDGGGGHTEITANWA